MVSVYVCGFNVLPLIITGTNSSAQHSSKQPAQIGDHIRCARVLGQDPKLAAQLPRRAQGRSPAFGLTLRWANNQMSVIERCNDAIYARICMT